jgi:hypothetical protein
VGAGSNRGGNHPPAFARSAGVAPEQAADRITSVREERSAALSSIDEALVFCKLSVATLQHDATVGDAGAGAGIGLGAGMGAVGRSGKQQQFVRHISADRHPH